MDTGTISRLPDTPQWAPLPPLTITTPGECVAVAERLKLNKAFQARVREFFAPHKRRADEMHKALCADEHAALRPALDDEIRDKAALVAYHERAEAERRAEEARLAEIARRDEEARRVEAAAALEREAARTGDDTLRAEAAAVLAEPAPVPAVVVPSSAPKVVGVSKPSYDYSARVVNVERFLSHVFAHPEFGRGLVVPDQKALDRMADGLRERFAVPGVELVKRPRLSVRR